MSLSAPRASWLARAGLFGVAMLARLTVGGPAIAQETGQPKPWQMSMQPPASPIAVEIGNFHELLLVIIFAISLLVLALLAYCAVRFNERRNPTPSRTTHNSLIEVIWTVAPVLVLVIIAIPSFRLLRNEEVFPVNAQGQRAADMTVKVTGYQWYWGIEYPGEEAKFKFDAIILQDEDRQKAIAAGTPAADVPRLLAVDNQFVVPVGKVIRVQVTSNDVIHSFSVPSLGFRRDAVPGRLNETWFKADREGVFYGQCSRLCGTNHAYMPFAFHAVSPETYASWLTEAKQKYAAIETPATVKVAGAAAPLN